MPKFLEKILQTAAAKKGFTGRRADRYVYGAMNRMGAMKGNVTTKKGERMAAKHARDVKAGTTEADKRRRSDSHILKAHQPSFKRKDANYG
jgi:hypothetical protein